MTDCSALNGARPGRTEDAAIADAYLWQPFRISTGPELQPLTMMEGLVRRTPWAPFVRPLPLVEGEAKSFVVGWPVREVNESGGM
jgi:hypothetical protein